MEAMGFMTPNHIFQFLNGLHPKSLNTSRLWFWWALLLLESQTITSIYGYLPSLTALDCERWWLKVEGKLPFHPANGNVPICSRLSSSPSENDTVLIGDICFLWLRKAVCLSEVGRCTGFWYLDEPESCFDLRYTSEEASFGCTNEPNGSGFGATGDAGSGEEDLQDTKWTTLRTFSSTEIRTV